MAFIMATGLLSTDQVSYSRIAFSWCVFIDYFFYFILFFSIFPLKKDNWYCYTWKKEGLEIERA